MPSGVDAAVWTVLEGVEHNPVSHYEDVLGHLANIGANGESLYEGGRVHSRLPFCCREGYLECPGLLSHPILEREALAAFATSFRQEVVGLVVEHVSCQSNGADGAIVVLPWSARA